MSKTYRTIQGDTWDLIAHKMYGEDKNMHILLQANIGLIDTVFFDAGVEIFVPEVVTKTVDTSISPWRR